ncbi:MAG: hypothetical protein R3A47_06310 [Polyangiales bacterium]
MYGPHYEGDCEYDFDYSEYEPRFSNTIRANVRRATNFCSSRGGYAPFDFCRDKDPDTELPVYPRSLVTAGIGDDARSRSMLCGAIAMSIRNSLASDRMRRLAVSC